MSFERMKPTYHKSLAWRLFKRHHTHFNDIFWAHKQASAHVYAATRPFNRSDPPSVLFNAGKYTRIPQTLGGWADHYSGFDQWTQMAAVMAICGYLETYIAQISTAAVESSPALILGGGINIDGAAFLKHNPSYDLYSHVEPLVRGDWQSRISSYSRLFGFCPFSASLSNLEKLRKLRNDTGHSFGRDIKSMKFSASSLVQKLPKVSNKDIQFYMGVAEDVANLIDNHLFLNYVGSYEAIKIFHNWLPTQVSLVGKNKLLAREFSRYFHTMTLNPHGKERSIEMINYYQAL